MFSFAGIPLADSSASVGESVLGWIYANIHPETLFPLASQGGYGLSSPILNALPEIPRPVVIDSLLWPVGASRFSRGHFIVSTSQLDAIRAVVLRNGTLAAAPFVFSDGSGSITTNLWHLPAIPLQKATPGLGLHLLTLVDDRYWWNGQSLDLAVNVGVTAWTDLYAAIAANLGIPIAVDPVNAAYGTPTEDYASGSRSLPQIFDAIAFSCGQRVVRGFNGSVKVQNAATAVATVAANLALGVNSYAGGSFDFNPRS